MALTQGHSVYAALSDIGMQKFLHNVFVARPHYFNFATFAMGGGVPDVGSLQPITVPGSNAGIDYSLSFSEPRILFYPSFFTTAPRTSLPISVNQFGISLDATMCVLGESGGNPTKICGTIGVWAVGHPVQMGSGESAVISLIVDQVLVSGTGNLDALFQYVVLKLLNALLTKLQIPAKLVAQGGFDISIEAGPDINAPSGNPPGQLQIWGGLS